MSELLMPGIKRTIGPAVAGFLLATLASRWGIVLTEKASVEFTAAITSVLTVVWYVGIRVAAQRLNMPALEKLLGSGDTPLYLKARKP